MGYETTPKRTYRLKKRADEMAETRRRIVEAAVELHGTVGPARTSVSAIADRAGVQRHTVYRHFPNEEAIFGACSAHYFTAHPWPDLEGWQEIGDPRERLRRAVEALYAYYEEIEPMLSNVVRDADLVEAVRQTLIPFERYLADVTPALEVGWGARGRRRVVLRAALRHAVAFETWRSLTAGGRITRGEAVAVASGLVEAVAAPPAVAHPPTPASSSRAKSSKTRR